ncbi:MAG: YdeI/OmpD-associated family protein [Deltaproteobacteria bacterium]|nr:YdeI/OmpD-associated family protein [Deltaproteobacteria bacterium]
MTGFAFTVEGSVEELDYGRMVYWVVRLPKAIATRAPFDEAKKVRFVGRIGGQKVALAWLTDARGHYCMVSKAVARAAKVTVSSRVRVEFDLAGEDDVEVPPEIREALRQEPAFRKPWKALTPGKQRGLCHMVAKMKNEDARALKAVAILTAVAEGNVPGPPPRRRT